ncbi:RagB/SusD family nutrient uptake outer membrane protein [Pedobacter sp. NJ-S-72]
MNHKIYIAALIGVCLLSCKKSLDTIPQGTAASSDLNTPANVDKMVIAAYSALGNDEYMTPYSSMWPYGSIRSGDAYKGGDGPGDINEFHGYETFSLNRVDYGPTDALWFRLYLAIGRANDALARVNAISTADFPNKTIRQGELRFLRGHFYFLLKILFKYVPYIDETIAKENYSTISNRALTDDALWTKIEDDFSFAAANLPPLQPEIGRANKFAAKAYLAKTLLYHAYTQDGSNNVGGIDQPKLIQVNSLCDEVINSGSYALSADFANNFLSQFENSKESVFAIQYSINDGTPQGRADFGHELNYPMNQEYGCCGFHVPSNNLINAFKTDNTGLPMITTFNSNDVEPAADYQTNSFDPRMDHTVAIPGHPYKYRPAFIFQTSWARAPQIYGPHLSMKETVLPDDPAFKKFPPFMSSGKNWAIIRYADVLLFKAEALIELGRSMEALPLINQIRQRAVSSESLLKQANGSTTSNYKIDIYKPGINCMWSTDFARQALRFERRLEFAMEGYRFFDLVRWGIAADYMNNYFTIEKTRKPHLQDAFFQKNRDEYLPIPLNQINFSKGLYKQNAGW